MNSASNGTDSTSWTPTGTLQTDMVSANGVVSNSIPWHSLAAMDYEGVNTYKLSLTNFGFSLPATDIVTSITVTLKHMQSASRYAGTNITDQTIQLIGLPAPDVTSSNKADGTNLPTSLTLKTYGTDPVAYWGLTAPLTGTDVNLSSFGVAVAYKGTPYTPSTIGTATPIPFVPTVSLDYVEIALTTVAGGTHIMRTHVANGKIMRGLIL